MDTARHTGEKDNVSDGIENLNFGAGVTTEVITPFFISGNGQNSYTNNLALRAVDITATTGYVGFDSDLSTQRGVYITFKKHIAAGLPKIELCYGAFLYFNSGQFKYWRTPYCFGEIAATLSMEAVSGGSVARLLGAIFSSQDNYANVFFELVL